MLLSEQANISLLPSQLYTSTGIIPSLALNNGYSQILSLYNDDAHISLGIVPQPVGTNLVLIDCKNRLMWYLPLTLGKYDQAQNGMIDLEVNGWGYTNPNQRPAPANSGNGNFVGFAPDSDSAGWRVPETSELAILQQQILAAGDGTESGSSVNAGLQNLGFSGLKDLQDHDNFKKIWFNGAVQQSDSYGHTGFYYFDLEQGKTVDGETTELHPNADPLYTIAYVRSINFNDPNPQPATAFEAISDANYFGDTTQQIYKAYGQAPTSLSYIPKAIGNTTQATVIEIDSVSGYHEAIQDHVTPGNQIPDWLTWSLELPTNNPNAKGVAAGEIAFITFVPNPTLTPTTPPLPGASSNVRVVFKRPGTVVLRGTVHDPGNPTPTSLTYTATSTISPQLTAIGVSPQNVAYTTPGNSLLSEQYHCTGYLANGMTVDLTQFVN